MTQPPANRIQGRANSARVTAKRPSSIAELAERATIDILDGSKDFKYYLRLAEKHRKEGKEYAKRGDLESAFVELARAATLVLEKLPEHKEYNVVLNATQRHNLGLNGQDILDNLGELKPTLVDRYDKWLKNQQDAGADLDRTPNARPQRFSEESPTKGLPPQRVRHESGPPAPRSSTTADKAMAEELEKWRQQRLDSEAARDQLHRTHRKEAAAAAAQKAANIPRLPPPHDLTFSRTPMQNAGYGTQNTIVISDPRPPEEMNRHQQQQEELRLREEEMARRQAEKRRQDQQEGIARRQRESDEAARMARLNLSGPTSSSASSGPAYYQPPPPPPHIEYPPLQSNKRPSPHPPERQGSYVEPHRTSGPVLLPLENPSRYDGESTDSESVHNHARRVAVHQKAVEHRQLVKHVRSPPPYPVPITTTSPPPDAVPIRYPALMSQHQKTQGYYPSLGSMFADSIGANPANASVLFGMNSNDGSKVNGALYPSGVLSPPTVDPQQQQTYYGGRPHHQHHQHHQHHHHHPPSSTTPHTGPSTTSTNQSAPPGQSDLDRIVRSNEALDRQLKMVSLPRECLPRFLAIAKVNTEMNKETCGLLLGKDKGHKFVVTTLLIPKQHSTSDTCTMDEEELVLQFTEERSLITLGWIHTHPSQSCFMSSVDLHTHSGFQRMLPESFAVVCAPKSNPNFGIFRLTDPPGLQTILACDEKEAFHPHPDIPIYTDADKGHVQIKDTSLEIVDLR